MTKQHCPPLGWILFDLTFATVRRVAEVTVDTYREWKRVCEETERAERREEESE